MKKLALLLLALFAPSVAFAAGAPSPPSKGAPAPPAKAAPAPAKAAPVPPAKGPAAPAAASVLSAVPKSRPPVTFRHDTHAAVPCRTCHHKDGEGKERSCFACHGERAADEAARGRGGDAKPVGGPVVGGRRITAKDAFHVTCKKCHGAAKKGPVQCDGCHRAQ